MLVNGKKVNILNEILLNDFLVNAGLLLNKE